MMQKIERWKKITEVEHPADSLKMLVKENENGDWQNASIHVRLCVPSVWLAMYHSLFSGRLTILLPLYQK